MLVKWLFFFLVCLTTSLFSAGPIVHLWVAERFCVIHDITKSDILEGIIIGTEFPDIRYISNISRRDTHPSISEAKEIFQSETSFEMGMKLHAWVDITRENFITQEIYDAVAPYAEGFSATLLKFIEEEMIADFYDGRKWAFYLDKVLPEELAFINEEVILKWHRIIQWTMILRPSWLLWVQSYRGSSFGVPARTLYNWSCLLPELKKKPIFQDYLQALLTHLEAQLQKNVI